MREKTTPLTSALSAPPKVKGLRGSTHSKQGVNMPPFLAHYFSFSHEHSILFLLPLGLNLSSTGRKPSLTAHLCHVHLTLGPKAPLNTDLNFSEFVFSCFGSSTEYGGHAGLDHHCTTRTPYRCSKGSKQIHSESFLNEYCMKL